MILHPFAPVKYALSFNRKRERLMTMIDVMSTSTFELNNEYWEINRNEEILCNEDEILDTRKLRNFFDDSFE